MGALNSVISLFQDVTKDLDNASFGFGSPDDFNSIPNKKFPYNWVDPLKGTIPTDGQVSNLISWNVSINFLRYDELQGNEKATAIAQDKEFDRMEKWLHKLDIEFINDEASGRITSGRVEIKNVSFEPMRKGFADFVSGWQLTFILVTESDFTYCSIYD